MVRNVRFWDILFAKQYEIMRDINGYYCREASGGPVPELSISRFEGLFKRHYWTTYFDTRDDALMALIEVASDKGLKVIIVDRDIYQPVDKNSFIQY